MAAVGVVPGRPSQPASGCWERLSSFVVTVQWEPYMKYRSIPAISIGACLVACSFALAGCGAASSDGPAQEKKSREQMPDKAVYPGSVTVHGSVAPKALGDTPIPADANTKGMWSAVVDWPLIAVHAVLMPDGRVLSYGSDGSGNQTGYFIYDVWSPSAGFGPGSHLTLPNQTATDIFCGSQVVLPQTGAGVFLAGGDIWNGDSTNNSGNNNSNLFNYANNSLARAKNMLRQRWYSSSTTLLNGEVYIQGGAGGTDRPEIRGVDGTFRLLSGANTSAYDFQYPRNFVAPDGRIFGYDSNGKMYYVNPTGTGSLTTAGQFQFSYTGNASSAAMFRPGKILQFGGGSNEAIVIDINGSAPVVTQTQSMSTQRILVNATLLPNGNVLATGGSGEFNELVNVNNRAEMWNPTTGTWTLGSAGVQARLYHSNALLLPDASVLVAGGGAPGPQNNLNAEIYYPPYLFGSGGSIAARPRIATAPTALVVGRSFTLDFADAPSISRVVLIKNGSTTHSWNMEQRFLDLGFTSAGQRLTVQMSSRAADTPPGYYMLFVLNAQGVPSIAKIVWINVAGAPDPQTAPVITHPANQSGTVGVAQSLTVTASDANGDALSFSATGLPPGLSMSPAGQISGTPTARGTYNPVVSVSDGVASDSASFTWAIVQGAELVLNPQPTPAPAQTGTDVTFTASAAGTSLQYKWSFGDGTAPTAYSTSPTATHRFTLAGLFFVTLTVTDASGAEKYQTFLQVVHRPLTARAATESSGVVYERPAGEGQARVWMVNPDNDSVSVFDATNGTRISEIVVGTSPRAIAIDAAGQIWVTNKRSANIKIIDPATLAVSRTISVTRVSQPHGIAMSPAGDFAYVVLEATGQLVKYRTSDFKKLLTVAVGPNPRHVSVTADGATIYVSRFITPPQPGESTASVQTTSNGAPTGGEIVKLRATDLAQLGKVVLAFSAKADAENRGRGVPNYLGPLAISPDGSQAWVPSKQDNIQRGALRDGNGLNFQNTVRAISSRVVMPGDVEDLASRIDHDNSSVATAAAFDPLGVLMFVALETSREIAVVNAHAATELFRFEVGRAPQGVTVSPDGRILYVANFMDRSLGVYDLSPFWNDGQLKAQLVTTTAAVGVEKLAAPVLAGKQLFYDARDTRLALDRYMSCASCHNDGAQDGRVWDLTGFGEGLRNTIALNGRGGKQGFLHWSGNFDEVQDFEGQIRNLAGGTGLMDDTAFYAGSRAQPLGTPKAGISPDLDSLQAYVASLTSFDYSPYRLTSTTISDQATAGKAVFAAKGCASCHAGTAYTGSGAATLVNIGTLQPASGSRLGGPLVGIDIPTLRDVWATAPYLHDGSRMTLEAAVSAHNGLSFTGTELPDLVAFLKSIGREEAAPAVPAGPGLGLRGDYFNNKTLTAPIVLTRNEAVDFSWADSPGTGVSANSFSVRWTGTLIAPATGSYVFQTVSNDGVRLRVNNASVIDNWTAHSSNVTDTSGAVNLVAGQSYAVVVEYYDVSGTGQIRLRWQTPGTTSFVKIPQDRLAPP